MFQFHYFPIGGSIGLEMAGTFFKALNKVGPENFSHERPLNRHILHQRQPFVKIIAQSLSTACNALKHTLDFFRNPVNVKINFNSCYRGLLEIPTEIYWSQNNGTTIHHLQKSMHILIICDQC